MTTSISTAVSNAVSTQLAPIRQDVSQLKQNQSEFGAFLNIMKDYVKSSDKRFESIQNSFLALGVKAQAPSEADRSPPGVGL